MGGSTGRRLGAVSLLVRDYDEAKAFFTTALGFTLVEDRELGRGKRWLVVAPPGTSGASLLLAKAADAAQEARIGDQTGGRVAFFLETDDFARDHARMTQAGVRFPEAPRHESYGTVAVFEDLYGNLWDLIEPVRPSRIRARRSSAPPRRSPARPPRPGRGSSAGP